MFLGVDADQVPTHGEWYGQSVGGHLVSRDVDHFFCLRFHIHLLEEAGHDLWIGLRLMIRKEYYILPSLNLGSDGGKDGRCRFLRTVSAQNGGFWKVYRRTEEVTPKFVKVDV